MSDETPPPVPRGNQPMRERYALAYTRIKLAMNAGFPIEATMICESIMADRLASHLRKRFHAGFAINDGSLRKIFNAEQGRRKDPHPAINTLWQELQHHFDDFGIAKYSELPARIGEWTQARNDAAHGFVKAHLFDRTYKTSHDEFLEGLNACARDGLVLARLVSNWTRSKGALHVQR